MWCLPRDSIISIDKNGSNTQFIGTFIDITDRKQAEISLNLLNNELENLVKQRTSELEKSLKTQELLMKEIHHRVKNNLQLLISMFSLYAVKEKNKNIVNAIEECKNKIYSLALIYQNLYHHKDLSNINLKDYLSQLCRHIEDSMKGNNLVSLKLKLQSTKISIDNAVTLGLITNELITNCYKHAFPGNCEGIISVDLTLIDKKLTLNIKDNGIGLPQSFNIKNTGFGLEMVSALVGQMNATMEIINSNGLLFSITFTTNH